MKYRYYLGLQLPTNVSKIISELQEELFDPIESVEPLEPHITLLPPPAVENIKPDELAVHAKAAALSSLPLEITLDKVITFRGHAVALQVDCPEIYELQKRLVSLLPFETNIVYFPNPKFQPHVTLVQAIHGHTLPSQLIQEYKDRIAPELPLKCTVKRLTLFEWTSPRKYIAKKI